ncbi:VapC toxin family PIN domain ribonuclease [Brachybacterium endophyticum]|uniref:Ribonuclease VapC n=1 Tax=Brachybacterium endophyticum TaxID=2182385 RepID=A0A2U2RJF4_9MICO|nr:type II toxin-antitoxin system VapC family toxin [Brachybacterium endophyticum]PWH05990.1 VapC toxin family PIN domain ribonuclease [Brachybacterium endophyticum]
MTFLLDTNVISELRKPQHRMDTGVNSWASTRLPQELHLSAITILEIELGIARHARRNPEQADRLRVWLEEQVLEVFSRRILPVDVHVARRAAHLHVPDQRPERDALIAATAMVHGLTVVTRNTSDFAPTGVALLDPWSPREA